MLPGQARPPKPGLAKKGPPVLPATPFDSNASDCYSAATAAAAALVSSIPPFEIGVTSRSGR